MNIKDRANNFVKNIKNDIEIPLLISGFGLNLIAMMIGELWALYTLIGGVLLLLSLIIQRNKFIKKENKTGFWIDTIAIILLVSSYLIFIFKEFIL